LKLWMMWRNPKFDWELIMSNQAKIASKLVDIGDSLILPGDPDWNEPKFGLEDWNSVSKRELV